MKSVLESLLGNALTIQFSNVCLGTNYSLCMCFKLAHHKRVEC